MLDGCVVFADPTITVAIALAQTYAVCCAVNRFDFYLHIFLLFYSVYSMYANLNN